MCPSFNIRPYLHSEISINMWFEILVYPFHDVMTFANHFHSTPPVMADREKMRAKRKYKRSNI